MSIVSAIQSYLPENIDSAEGRNRESREYTQFYFPLDIGDDKYTKTMTFKAGELSYSGSEIQADLGEEPDWFAAVELYMPHNIEEEDSVDWSETEVGYFGQKMATKAANTNLSSLRDIIESASELGEEYYKTAGNQALKGAYNVLGSAVGSEEAASAALAREGRAVNPKVEMLFQGVGFREYQFTFSMYPKSESEANMVGAIINFFKTTSKPSLNSDKFFFEWPQIFKIEFNEKDYLFEFEPSALTSVSTNYTPEGIWTELKNGAPVGVEISLSFIELNIRTRNYNSYR